MWLEMAMWNAMAMPFGSSVRAGLGLLGAGCLGKEVELAKLGEPLGLHKFAAEISVAVNVGECAVQGRYGCSGCSEALVENSNVWC
jgi:hypothetical protein